MQLYFQNILSYHREFLVGQAPQLVKATSTYCVEGRLKIEQNDTIAIIDGRPELSFLKGQNQRTFETGTFPRNILEVLRFNRHGTLNTISRPVHGTLQHSSHGAAFGPTWGSPAYLDSSYNGSKVQMRENASKGQRAQRAVSEHFSKEKKASVGKQFSYNKLVNDHRMHYEQQMKHRAKPARPPAPQVGPQEGILIDLSPEEIRSMTMSLQGAVKSETQLCLLDEPIEVPTEGMVEPPPYPSPPQYLNTYAMNDPFDTTHIESVENLYSNTSAQPLYNNDPGRYSDQLNDMLSASLSTLSMASENINGQPVTPKKVEKQMLAEQLTGAKDASLMKLNLEQLVSAPPTRGFDPFSPIQPNVTFVSNDYSSQSESYAPQNAIYAPPQGSIYAPQSAVYNSSANMYSSVAGSVYGENFYDAVQSQTPAVIYDSTASVYNAQQQQAIYDEVSAYDELRWQPQTAALRPAPAPPNQPALSQQQIVRRLEKINQQHGAVAELMNKLSMDNISEEEAMGALELSNYNMDLATRHFKIERLSK